MLITVLFGKMEQIFQVLFQINYLENDISDVGEICQLVQSQAEFYFKG